MPVPIPVVKSFSHARLQSTALIEHQTTHYTPQQVTQYLDKIGYHDYLHEIDADSSEAPLQRLQLLMRLHLVTFPWDNTGMHYSETRVQDVSVEGVFQRLVVDGKGGSYCFGQNILFCGMLRALGFRCYTGSARILVDYKPDSPPPSVAHAIIFVQPFDGERARETYVTDVGFGGSGLTRPILLSDREDDFNYGTTKSEKHRLAKTWLKGSALGSSSFNWELQTWWPKQNPEWRSLYAFGEMEFFITDFIYSNLALCLMPTNSDFIRHNIVCCKHFFVDPNESRLEDDIAKYLMVANKLSWSLGEKSETITDFGPGQEKERLDALERYLGIIVDEGDTYISRSTAAL